MAFWCSLLIKTATQTLLPLHSIPVRFYIKAFKETKILIAINICMASLSWWSAPVKSSRKVSERHRWLLLSLHICPQISINCASKHLKRSCCCCWWSVPSLYTSLVASSEKKEERNVRRRCQKKTAREKLTANVKTHILWWAHFGVTWHWALWRKSKETAHISEQRQEAMLSPTEVIDRLNGI